MQIVDAAGHVLKASEAKGGGGTFSTIATAEYDPSGRTLKATDRDEVTITTSYDDAQSGTGKPVLVTATTEVSLPTTPPSTQTTNVQPPRYMQYDSAGNLRRQDERASFGGPTSIVWTYDVLGRPVYEGILIDDRSNGTLVKKPVSRAGNMPAWPRPTSTAMAGP